MPISATYLAFPVDSYDATAGIVHSSHKDSLPTDTVHVDASARLQVVKVDVAKLGDKVDYVVLGTHLERKEGQSWLVKNMHARKYSLAGQPTVGW